MSIEPEPCPFLSCTGCRRCRYGYPGPDVRNRGRHLIYGQNVQFTMRTLDVIELLIGYLGMQETMTAMRGRSPRNS